MDVRVGPTGLADGLEVERKKIKSKTKQRSSYSVRTLDIILRDIRKLGRF